MSRLSYIFSLELSDPKQKLTQISEQFIMTWCRLWAKFKKNIKRNTLLLYKIGQSSCKYLWNDILNMQILRLSEKPSENIFMEFVF